MKRLVLAGAGHAHAQVLLDACQAPLPGVEITVVSPHARAPYSGMVPGWLAGTYEAGEIVIDFPMLCEAAGARWMRGDLHALDATRRRLQLGTGESLDYDVLSLNVGSTLRPPELAHARLLPLRPLSRLVAGYDALLEAWMRDDATGPCTVTAVGGGAAGVESLLAVLARLRRLRPGRTVHGGLVSQSSMLLPGLSSPARRAAARALAQAGVTVQLGTAWCEAIDRSSDIVLWATGGEPHDWQREATRRGGLDADVRGFLRIDACLRSVSHPDVYAVGDCAHWASGGLPKSGVHAVRMGPVLSHNLRVALGAGATGRPRAYRPRRHTLALLATGDGRAIASWGPMGAAGTWVWRWKDQIDRGFIRRFAVAPAGPDGRRRPADLSHGKE